MSMDEYGTGQGIIKNTPYPWLMVVAGIFAAIFIIYYLFFLAFNPPDRAPDWAPDGCSIVRNTRDGARVMVRVNDMENFDTESELASTILAVLNNEVEFYTRNGAGFRGRIVQIEFPRSATGGTTRYLQYSEQYYDGLMRYYLIVSEGNVIIYEKEYYYLTDIEDLITGEETSGVMEHLFPDGIPE